MHHFYLVKIKAENANDAIAEATTALDDNNFASDSNGFFGSSKADWYVVGGRWSGVLANVSDGEREKRDSYKQNGYPDDAQPLTAELVKYLLREDYRTVEVFDPEEQEELTVDDYAEQDEPGTYLVAIDYHD